MTILKVKPDCCQVLEWIEAIKNKKAGPRNEIRLYY